MPGKEAHLAAARRNQVTIDYLLERVDVHGAWVVTVAFYKSLHVVEAVLAADPHAPVPHCDNHEHRNRVLKRTGRYTNIWKHYQPLYGFSMISRYLHDVTTGTDHPVFDRFMSPDDIRAKVLGHYVLQIERSAERLIGPLWPS